MWCLLLLLLFYFITKRRAARELGCSLLKAWLELDSSVLSWLTHLAVKASILCQLLSRDLGSLWHGSLHGLLVCPCDMAFGFLQSEWSKRRIKMESTGSFITYSWKSHAFHSCPIPLIWSESVSLACTNWRELKFYLLKEGLSRIYGLVWKPPQVGNIT